MKLWKAILLVVSLYVFNGIIYHLTRHNCMWYITLGTTLWAAIDSSKIGLKRYRGGVGPVVFFCLCILWWMIGFTWYLWMRDKILTGKAELMTNDPRCVRCEELIDPTLQECPKCGWPQPK